MPVVKQILPLPKGMATVRLMQAWAACKSRRKRARETQDDPLCPISAQLAALLKVRLLTAQRGGEVAHMRWADVDLQSGWWTIPGSDTKNGEPHRVPLVADRSKSFKRRSQTRRSAACTCSQAMVKQP